MSNRGGRILRELMQKGECLCLPGAFNGFVGRLCASTGFNGCYISGAAVTACYGVPDIGLLSIEQFANKIKEVSMASGLPVLADADTGFGEVEMITKTVYEYHTSGAAGMHIEDQIFPKKCGHLEGKQLVEADAFCDKIRRAVKASDTFTNGEFVVCARTDAAAVEGIKSAIERAQKYTVAGAHMIFPEGLESEAEFAEFAASMKSCPGEAPGGGPYLLANMTEFGKTPEISVDTFKKLGYHAVIFPVSTFRVAMKPVEEFLTRLKKTGKVDTSDKEKMFNRKELYKALKYDTNYEWVYPCSTKQ